MKEQFCVNHVKKDEQHSAFIRQIISDIEQRKDEQNFAYFYRGYYYNITSKILPYCVMYEKMNQNDLEVFRFYKEMVSEWKKITKYMYFKLFRGNVMGDDLINKLKDIEMKYIEFEMQ